MTNPEEKIPDLVFDPDAPAFRRRLWVRISTPAGPRIIFIWPRILMLLAVLLVAGWLALAGAIWGFVKYQRGIAEVSFVDLAFYPLRQTQYRASLGSHYLATAKQAIEARKWEKAMQSLRASLTYAPEFQETRLILAELYQRIGQPERSLQILDEGAAYARTDLSYLQRLVRLAEAQRDLERILRLGQAVLPDQPDAEPAHRYVAHRAAAALIELRRFAEAEELIMRWELDQQADGQILLARISMARDRPEEAVQRLEHVQAKLPREESISIQLTRLYLQLGRLTEARRTAFLRSLANPASAGARIDLLNLDWQLGRREDFAQGADRFLVSHAADAAALSLLAQVAADAAQPELAARVLAAARAASLPPAIFLCTLMQAQCAAGQFEPALATAVALGPEAGPASRVGTTIMAHKCWAFYGLQNEAEGDAWLHRFLSQRDFTPADAWRLATALEKLGATKAAGRLFTAAANHSAATADTLTAAVEFQVRHQAWAEAGTLLARLKALPRPPRDLIEQVESILTVLGVTPR
jgi:tetratricopeptide (TPR) repeat protein